MGETPHGAFGAEMATERLRLGWLNCLKSQKTAGAFFVSTGGVQLEARAQVSTTDTLSKRIPGQKRITFSG